MTRKIFEIKKDNNVITINFVENGKVGNYVQDLDKDGIDIKRVLRPITEDTEPSLRRKVTFKDGEVPEDIEFLSTNESIRQLENILK